MDLPTFGIEEEFLLTDERTGELREDAEHVLDRARELFEDGLDHELRAAMLEIGTAVCPDLGAAERDLRAHRHAVATAAAEVGARVLATASHPSVYAADVDYADEHRYRRIAEEFGQIADESLVCGCHVHVQVPDRETAVLVIDRIRPWLALLIALSANSPLWLGRDTGFDSWRSQVWSRWPTAGPTTIFGDLGAYERQADALIASGAALDRAMLYYDARVSERWPTVEIRVADVCLDVEDAAMIGALVRALVMTASHAIGEPAPDVSAELLRAATFQAARNSLRRSLVDPATWQARPAAGVITSLINHVQPALDETGDMDFVVDHVDRLLRRGTAAVRQRSAWQREGLAGVIELVTVN